MEELPEKDATQKTCLSCGSLLSGRFGKKFCSDQCRAQFNNRRKNKEEKWITHLNRILRKNRTILKTLNPTGHSTVRIEFLKDHGFDDRFYTHQYKTAKGEIYYFCYEFDYQLISKEKVIIVNWQKYMTPESHLNN